MISKTEKKRLKKILGNNYSEAVTQALASVNALNKHGLPYSKNQIIGVFNGARSHDVIEDAIYRAAKNAKRKTQLEKEKRKQILKLS